jgi:hypothetical protein
MANRPDPRLDSNSKPEFLLQHQLRGYKNPDPLENQQVAMTASLLREFYKLSLSTIDKARRELFIGAFFFAMRSWAYLKVLGTGQTNLLSLNKYSILQRKQNTKTLKPSTLSSEKNGVEEFHALLLILQQIQKRQ